MFRTFISVWFFQVFLYGVWSVILYPKVFSPLIGLPEPKGGSWLMGQFGAIRKYPTGIPMREWYVHPYIMSYPRYHALME